MFGDALNTPMFGRANHVETAEGIDAMEICKDPRAPKLLNTLQHQGLRRTRDGAKRRAENMEKLADRDVSLLAGLLPFWLWLLVHNKNMTLY